MKVICRDYKTCVAKNDCDHSTAHNPDSCCNLEYGDACKCLHEYTVEYQRKNKLKKLNETIKI